jgi:hypothetical protein
MKKHMTAAFFLAGLAVALGSGACSKKTDSNAPAAVPALQPGATAPAPSVPPPAAPSAPTAAPAKDADPGATITGKILVEPAIAKLKPKGTLYLVARRLSDNPTARGTLIAVKKFENATYPLSFTLSAADMPFQNGAFDGELSLSARIDQDGDPITRQKGDVFGTLPKVRVGSHDVKLPINEVQKEAESLGASGPMTGGGQLPPGHP